MLWLWIWEFKFGLFLDFSSRRNGSQIDSILVKLFNHDRLLFQFCLQITTLIYVPIFVFEIFGHTSQQTVQLLWSNQWPLLKTASQLFKTFPKLIHLQHFVIYLIFKQILVILDQQFICCVSDNLLQYFCPTVLQIVQLSKLIYLTILFQRNDPITQTNFLSWLAFQRIIHRLFSKTDHIYILILLHGVFEGISATFDISFKVFAKLVLQLLEEHFRLVRFAISGIFKNTKITGEIATFFSFGHWRFIKTFFKRLGLFDQKLLLKVYFLISSSKLVNHVLIIKITRHFSFVGNIFLSGRISFAILLILDQIIAWKLSQICIWLFLVLFCSFFSFRHIIVSTHFFAYIFTCGSLARRLCLFNLYRFERVNSCMNLFHLHVTTVSAPQSCLPHFLFIENFGRHFIFGFALRSTAPSATPRRILQQFIHFAHLSFRKKSSTVLVNFLLLPSQQNIRINVFSHWWSS